MKKRTQSEDRLHSIKSAAQFLGGVSESTVRVWLWQGRFQKIKIGRLVRIRQSELMKMIHPVTRLAVGTEPREPASSAFRPLEEIKMIDAIDELVSRSKTHHEVRAFHEFHKKHPEVLDFLVQEIRLRIEHGFEAFSYHSLWEYCRWKLELEHGPTATFLMNDHAAPFYARAITILHPVEFNGRAEFRKSKADAIFGTRIEPVPEKRPKNYARRLQWADGTAIEHGWRPSTPHVVNHAANRKPDIHGREA